MFNTSADNARKDPYLTQKIMSASPEQLVAYMYDAVILGCKKEDQDRALRALMGLIGSLRFDHKDIAVPMHQLYQYCLDQVRERNFVIVEEIIGGFRSAWAEAMNVS